MFRSCGHGIYVRIHISPDEVDGDWFTISKDFRP